MKKEEILKEIEILKEERSKLLNHVIGTSYNMQEALKLTKKIKELEDKKDGKRN